MATFTPWPGALRVLASAPGDRRPGGSPGLGSACAGAAAGGRGYLLQSLCSMLYTSSSRLRPSKNGMRSSSSVSVMSSNQDCTGTWKTGRRGQQACARAGGSQPDRVPVFLRTERSLRQGGQVSSHHHHHHRFVCPPRPNRDPPKAAWWGQWLRKAGAGDPACTPLPVSFSCCRKGGRSAGHVRTGLATCSSFQQADSLCLRAKCG